MKTTIIFALVSIVGFAVALLTISSNSTAKSRVKNIARKQTGVNDSDKSVCSLPSADWKDRQQVFQELSKGVIQRKELDDGFAWAFPAETRWFSAVTEVVSLERKCCAPLTFKIVVEADNGPIWLEVSGTGGAKEFLSRTLGFLSEPGVQ